jgi:hypothetical protein
MNRKAIIILSFIIVLLVLSISIFTVSTFDQSKSEVSNARVGNSSTPMQTIEPTVTPTQAPTTPPASTLTREQVVIVGVSASSNSSTISIYAFSTSHNDIVISSAIVKAQNGTIVGTVNSVSQTLPANGKYVTISIPAINTLEASSIYSVTLVTSEGNHFISPNFMYS